jgi:hypothetical protein
MYRGFIIEIINNNDIVTNLKLFVSDGLVDGVDVKVFNNDYDYNSLLLIAKTVGFSGNGILTDNLSIDNIKIVDDETIDIVKFDKILTDKKIYLNGTTKYICIDIPPKSISLLQLLPI